MMDVLLSRDRGYSWYEQDGMYVKGYLQLRDTPERVLRGADAVRYLCTAETFEAFTALLRKVDGVYAIVRQTADSVWAAVDAARSMPLYYAEDGSALSDSSEALRKRLEIDRTDTDPLRMAELMSGGAVSGPHTVYPQIKQLELGTAVVWNGGTRQVQRYYQHMAPIREFSREDAKKELRSTAERVFQNMLKVVGGRPIVLSLSGGYDSRFVACMLKEVGAEQVFCYTYGAEDSFEVKQSKKVAEALGYPWTCVTYTEEDIAGQFQGEGRSFIDAYCEHDFTTYLQNYIAVKRLHEMGWFPKDAVFLTGLCHDMPTGAYVAAQEESRYPISTDGVAEQIMDDRFVRYTLRPEARERYQAYLKEEIAEIGLDLHTYQDFVRVSDILNTGYAHSRRFLPMNWAHEFFGYEWLLPCWNRELLEFWYSLPYPLRMHQNLYEEWLMEDLCGAYGVGTKKTISRHTPYPWLTTVVRAVGGVVAWFCFKTNRPLHLRTDINGGAMLRQRLYDDIIQKRAIKYARASQAVLQTIYLMEQRYGDCFWDSVRKVLKK